MPGRKSKETEVNYLTRSDGTPRSRNPKQIRARVRRREAKGGGGPSKHEVELMLRKPLEEWDDEELARCRPRDKNGKFTGAAPAYITREMQERAFSMFAARIKAGTAILSVGAMRTLEKIIDNDEVDARGRPVVPASVKVDAAKYLIDRVLGKPTQPVETEVGGKLATILASVMVDQLPEGDEPPALSSTHRIVDITPVDEDDEEADE